MMKPTVKEMLEEAFDITEIVAAIFKSIEADASDDMALAVAARRRLMFNLSNHLHDLSFLPEAVLALTPSSEDGGDR